MAMHKAFTAHFNDGDFINKMFAVAHSPYVGPKTSYIYVNGYAAHRAFFDFLRCSIQSRISGVSALNFNMAAQEPVAGFEVVNPDELGEICRKVLTHLRQINAISERDWIKGLARISERFPHRADTEQYAPATVRA